MLNESGPEEQSEEARSRRARLLRVAAHDLRGPLANIKSYVSLLKVTKTPLEPRVQRSLEVIARNAERAIALVDDGLDAARHESGALVFDRQLQPLRPLVLEAIAAAQRQAEPLRVEIDAALAEDLPQLRLDGFRVRRAVEALVLHVVTRSKPGQRVRVVCSREPGDRVRLQAVQPEGAELPADPFVGLERILGERLFEDPVRMWLAALTAEAHGGYVERLGGGECGVALTLPLGADA